MSELPERRERVSTLELFFALIGFGYWHYGLLLAIVAVAAGLKKAIGDPYDPLDTWITAGLAGGVALFVAGTEVAATAQVGALAAVVALALVAEGSKAVGRVAEE